MRFSNVRQPVLLLVAALLLFTACDSKETRTDESPPAAVERCKDAHVLGEANMLTVEQADLTKTQLRSTLEFLVPDDLVSVVLTLEAPDAIVMWDRISIDDQLIARLADLFGSSGLSRAMPLFPNVASVLYPNNEATADLGDCLRVKASLIGTGVNEGRLTLTTLRRPERVLGEHIDLQFRIYDNAISEEEAEQIATTLKQLYYGACDGFDCLLPKVHAEPLHIASEDGAGVVELDDLMAYDSGFAQLAMVEDDTVPRGLNVVFVNELIMKMPDDDEAILLGMAGGVPATPFDGTPGSSLVISVDAHRLGADNTILMGLISSTVAHEVGHMMGLFHTTEQDGTNFDPLQDTLQCDVQTYDADNDGRVDSDECAEAGADNLMFWQAAIGFPSRLSPAQARVLRAHPLVYRK